MGVSNIKHHRFQTLLVQNANVIYRCWSQTTMFENNVGYLQHWETRLELYVSMQPNLGSVAQEPVLDI